MFKLPAYFTGFASKADGSASLRFTTQELQASDFATLKLSHSAFGWLLFSEADLSEKDIPTETIEEDDISAVENKDMNHEIQIEEIVEKVRVVEFLHGVPVSLPSETVELLRSSIRSAIHQAEQEMLKRVVEHIKKYNPKSLDTGVAGKIEEGILQRAKDDLLASLAKPLPTNPKGE